MKAPVALRWPWTVLAVSLIGLAGCAVGPKYARPSVQVPSAYKELNVGDTGQSDLWKTAQPQGAAARGNWWEAFDDIERQNEAVQSAGRSLQEAHVRFQSGIDPYLNVIAAQTTLLDDQQAVVGFRMQQMVASVQLIKALGGSWNVAQLPSPQQLRSNAPLLGTSQGH